MICYRLFLSEAAINDLCSDFPLHKSRRLCYAIAMQQNVTQNLANQLDTHKPSLIVPCALCLVPCALCLVPCALCLVPCALCLVPCALCLVALKIVQGGKKYFSLFFSHITACSDTLFDVSHRLFVYQSKQSRRLANG